MDNRRFLPFHVLPLLVFLSFPLEGQTLNVFYVPLDERFTTRNAFLNLAKVTPFNITTPPLDIISSQKIPAPLPLFDNFVQQYLPAADVSIISLELYIYGGLINSRCSNDTEAEVLGRAQMLVNYAVQNPRIRFHIGTVVMRIPSYNEDVEEPWYWAYYGADLYTYSYYLDKYQRVSHNDSDLQLALAAEALVPPTIVKEFVLRRQRNFNVTVFLLQQLAKSIQSSPNKPIFQSMYITLDDNAEYGFNIAESIQLKNLVASLNLNDYVLIYPGADEVGLTMLAKVTVSEVQNVVQRLNQRGTETVSPRIQSFVNPPMFQLQFRKPDNESLHLIPNYEGQPMIYTLLDQIKAAGASVSGNWSQELQNYYRDVYSTNNVSTVGSPSWIRPWRCSNTIDCDDSRNLVWNFPSSSLYSMAASPVPILFVNNFGPDEYPQIEAPDQIFTNRSVNDYSMFTPLFCGNSTVQSSVISFADNRYSNGADILFTQYLYGRGKDPTCLPVAPSTNLFDRAAYAGWNTDGNTVGTSIANLVLLYYFADFGPYNSSWLIHQLQVNSSPYYESTTTTTTTTTALSFTTDTTKNENYSPSVGEASQANSYFNALRFVEDCHWQAELRQTLVSYVNQVNEDTVYTLNNDLTFYERYAYKVLSSRLEDINSSFNTSWILETAYYPWNRTFEIGLIADT